MAVSCTNRPIKILIVDDDEQVCTVFRMALTLEGYQVSVARSGEEGIRLVVEHENMGTPFDLVLLDLVMEGIGGRGFLQHLHHHRRRPRVVVITGRATTEDTVVVMRLGAQGVLDKPTRLEDLVPEVKRILALESEPLARELRNDPGKVGDRDEVARRFTVAPQTVSNRLRRQTGRAFREFMHDNRIEQAKWFLAETELEAKEIAVRLGFKSYRTFARVFRQSTGSSPREYRRQSRLNRQPGGGEHTSDSEPHET